MNPWGMLALKAAIVAVLGLVAVLAGGPIVLRVFAAVDGRRPPAVKGAGEDPDSPGVEDAAQVLKGGSWIGRLERLAVFAALVAGSPEAMALALGLKGLARYPELKATTSGAAERFIIGTFVSVMVAAACAGLAFWLVRVF